MIPLLQLKQYIWVSIYEYTYNNYSFVYLWHKAPMPSNGWHIPEEDSLWTRNNTEGLWSLRPWKKLMTRNRFFIILMYLKLLSRIYYYWIKHYQKRKKKKKKKGKKPKHQFCESQDLIFNIILSSSIHFFKVNCKKKWYEIKSNTSNYVKSFSIPNTCLLKKVWML